MVKVGGGRRNVGSDVALGETVNGLTAGRVDVVQEGVALGVVRHSDALGDQCRALGSWHVISLIIQGCNWCCNHWPVFILACEIRRYEVCVPFRRAEQELLRVIVCRVKVVLDGPGSLVIAAICFEQLEVVSTVEVVKVHGYVQQVFLDTIM